MPKTHEITIALVKDQHGEHAIPRIPDSGAMQVGDTVHYVSNDGVLRVKFPEGPTFPEGKSCKGGSPFKGGMLTVSGSQSLTLERGGLFECRCFLTLHDGRKIGWTKNNLQSGGVHDIQPH